MLTPERLGEGIRRAGRRATGTFERKEGVYEMVTEQKSGAVVFARDVAGIANFYEEVIPMRLTHADLHVQYDDRSGYGKGAAAERTGVRRFMGKVRYHAAIAAA